MGCSVFSQTPNNTKKYVGKSFWTKFVLPTDSDCKIKIAPDDIVTDDNYCKYTNHLETNTKIKLKKLSSSKGWKKLTFEDSDKYEFSIYLQDNSKNDFQKSFDLAFSKKKLADDEAYRTCPEKTKLEVIKKLGIPSTISRKGRNEIWDFEVGWAVGFNACGFDAMTIEIVDGFIKQIGGIV